jgi:RNA polymerase sigma factor (sigma-70 family)
VTAPHPDHEQEITATVRRESGRLGDFIRRRVPDPTDAEDILQDVLEEFVEAYRLPSAIEQVSAWLFRVARNRIVDRFRKKREEPLRDAGDPDDDDTRLDLALPDPDGGPEAAYARSVLLCRILFGGFRGYGGWRRGWHGHRFGHRRCGPDWHAMTPEEREQFRRGIRPDHRPDNRSRHQHPDARTGVPE